MKYNGTLGEADLRNLDWKIIMQTPELSEGFK
jgi:hypothetical protein